MKLNPDILIIGSGVIGLSTAYLLAKRGLRVSILDRGDPGRESSWAGAGIIPPGNLARSTHPIERLRARSSETLPQWAAELESETGQSVGYRRCGGLELFERMPDELIGLWREEEIPFAMVSENQLLEICPNLSSSRLAFHFPTMAQIRNPWYLRALVTIVQKLGVTLLPNTEVIRFETHQSKITGVLTKNDSRLIAGKFLLSPGAWGGRMLELLGLELPVFPVRGQIVLFRTEPGLLAQIVSADKEYFVPRGDGRVLVGATEDPEAGFDKSSKATDVKLLTEFAIRHVPKLKDAAIEQSWAGLRPGSPGGIPFIGPVPGYSNAFFSGGHYRAGIQLSPGTAMAMCELLTDESPWLDLSPFRLDRLSTEARLRPFQS